MVANVYFSISLFLSGRGHIAIPIRKSLQFLIIMYVCTYVYMANLYLPKGLGSARIYIF